MGNHPATCPLFEKPSICVPDCPWWTVAVCTWQTHQAQKKQADDLKAMREAQRLQRVKAAEVHKASKLIGGSGGAGGCYTASKWDKMMRGDSYG